MSIEQSTSETGLGDLEALQDLVGLNDGEDLTARITYGELERKGHLDEKALDEFADEVEATAFRPQHERGGNPYLRGKIDALAEFLLKYGDEAPVIGINMFQDKTKRELLLSELGLAFSRHEYPDLSMAISDNAGVLSPVARQIMLVGEALGFASKGDRDQAFERVTQLEDRRPFDTPYIRTVEKEIERRLQRHAVH